MTAQASVKELLTIEEVADRLRVSVPTVRWLRQEGRFAPATWSMATSGRRRGSSGTSRGHLSRLKRRSKMRATRNPAEMPGSGGVVGGAAYRNRTDDLRITSASL